MSGLDEEDKVACVRLALFAEMMKSRVWTPGSLREVARFVASYLWRGAQRFVSELDSDSLLLLGNAMARGGGGAPEISSACGEIFIIMRQARRSFVAKLDFVTSFGHGEGGDEGRPPVADEDEDDDGGEQLGHALGCHRVGGRCRR